MLSDEATVVGVQLSDNSVITKEYILDKSCPVVTYGAGRSALWTLAVDQQANVLLAGEIDTKNGRVVQYRLGTGEAVHDYGSLGIGAVISNARLGNLCFFGGHQSSSFAVVDTLTQKVLEVPFTTAIKSIHSLAVCTISPNTPDAKAVLAVAGTGVNYSVKLTDMFDVTQLVYRHGSRQIVAELPVSIDQSKQDIVHKVRTLKQQLQQQAHASKATVKAKDRELRRLESENQALRKSFEQRLRELQDKCQVQATVNASLQAEVSSLEQRLCELQEQCQVQSTANASLQGWVSSLEQQAQAHSATIKAKDHELDQLESGNQALRDALQHLEIKQADTMKKLQKQIIWNERKVPEKVVLGLLLHSSMRLDANPLPAQMPNVEIDPSDSQ